MQDYVAKDPRIQALKTPRHQKSAAYAINDALLNKATGDIGIWLNADDAFFAHTLETFVPYFTDPKVGFVRVGITAYWNEDITVTQDLVPPTWNELSEIFYSNKVFPESPVRMALFKAVKGCDEDLRFYDWAFWTKCVRECMTGTWIYGTHTEPLILRRIHGIAEYQAIDEEQWSKLKQPGPGIRYRNMAQYQHAGGEAIRRKYLVRSD
jgi:hypothetical protein